MSLSGFVLTDEGDTVARITSEHDGMGLFAMPPQSGQSYRAVVTAGDGRKRQIRLPAVKEDGYAISVDRSSGKDRYRITAAPGSAYDSLTLVAHVRGDCLTIVPVDPSNPSGEWQTDSLPEGILHLILLDARARPCSERLVFISHPARREHWSIAPDKAKYGRREQICVRISLSDEDSIPIGADCSISITDSSPTFYADDYHGFSIRDASYVKVDHTEKGVFVEAKLKPQAELQRRARAIGAEICKMAGYAESVKFYAPIYSIPELQQCEKPDIRTTVYWNPSLKIGNDGTGSIHFYTDDNDSPQYDITIEGITRDGKPCMYRGHPQ